MTGRDPALARREVQLPDGRRLTYYPFPGAARPREAAPAAGPPAGSPPAAPPAAPSRPAGEEG